MPAGRFAPSPTGPLHLGSLLAAVASYICAKQAGLQWLVRFDDLDTPRNQPGVEPHILQTLQAHGLIPDAPAIYQSKRIDRYQRAFDQLTQTGRCFYCRCARKSLPKGAPYPGTCRQNRSLLEDSAVRYRTFDHAIEFDDLLQGTQCIDPVSEIGDFIVRRRDQIFAYHLACAVDDGAEEIVQVVRGKDLLLQTGPQLMLMHALDLAVPTYAHLPLITDAAGIKLSKQSHAPTIHNAMARENLRQVMAALGLADPPNDAVRWSPADWISWGTDAFCLAAVPSTSTKYASD